MKNIVFSFLFTFSINLVFANSISISSDFGNFYFDFPIVYKSLFSHQIWSSKNSIIDPNFEVEKSFNYSNKSKRRLFNLVIKFVNNGWKAPNDVYTVNFDEFINETKPKYDLNNPIQIKDKEKGIIKCHIISRFASKFHLANKNNIWFEYDIEFIIKGKSDISIRISNINTDEFISDEQKISESYKTKVNNLESELNDIPDQFNQFILNN